MSSSFRVQSKDAVDVGTFLTVAGRRLTAISATTGASVGLTLAALFVVWTVVNPISTALTVIIVVMLAIAGAIAGALTAPSHQSQAAVVVERSAPQCRNLVLTAQQLISGTSPQTPIASVVYRQAATLVQGLNASQLFPAKRSALMLMFSGVLLIVALTVPKRHAIATAQDSPSDGDAALTIQHVDVTVVSPAYTGVANKSVRDPSRIEALAGSHVTMRVASAAATLDVETLHGKHSVAASGNNTFSVDVIADADGFVALQPASALGGTGTRKLIGLTVTPDQAPRVRIAAPAKDMMFPDANRSLDLFVEADDDIALSTLRLRYTQVSGSGERYTFKEGELPLQVVRAGDRTWTAKAHWDLGALGLEAGDMVVYRAAVTDKRPGSPASESDSYIAEILTPGSDAAAGFSIDPDQERYALSQQMIIVKTERLTLKRASISAQAFIDEANDIAVEQRRVRAEFVFMMGGELADDPKPEDDMTMLNEEEEAEGESDILAGRGANMGRIALQQAIRSMSAAATLLNTNSVPDALERERAALKQLERAFSHTRIILRALTEVERLDLTRRMTGPLLEAGRDVHASANPDEASRVIALRSALAGVAELSGSSTFPDASVRASSLAEQVLRVAPSEKPLQVISALLDNAATAFGKRDMNAARQQLDSAAVKLTASIRAEIVAAPVRSRTLQSNRLDGALTDAFRRSPARK